jgi:hypothetical protein
MCNIAHYIGQFVTQVLCLEAFSEAEADPTDAQSKRDGLIKTVYSVMRIRWLSPQMPLVISTG